MGNEILHNIPPLYDENSQILILGSFPSVKSREGRFFYDHPQNRFWRVMERLYCVEPFESREEKAAFARREHIAMWDVIASCEISGSSDASIRNIRPNDIAPILGKTKIDKIFCNGTTSYNLYNRYIRESTGIEAVKLPSTSPANASYSLDRLVHEWEVIKK